MLCFILHARLRVHLASGIPCALFTKGAEKFLQNSGAWRREIAEACHVDSSPLPPAREARGGEGAGVGGVSAYSRRSSLLSHPHPRPLPTTRKSASGEG